MDASPKMLENYCDLIVDKKRHKCIAYKLYIFEKMDAL